MKNQSFTIAFILFLLAFGNTTITQDSIALITNPSFEDTPRKGRYYSRIMDIQRNEIKGWTDCGQENFKDETAPDIHAEPMNFWKVQMYPSHGKTFLGLVVRDNISWEEVSQELLQVIEAGQCYTFTLDLAMADPYISGSRLHNDHKDHNYNTPALLNIWGGMEACEHHELLYTSPPITNQEWKTYEVSFCTESDVQYISLQAYYVDGSREYNGNVLVDNISAFQWVGVKK